MPSRYEMKPVLLIGVALIASVRPDVAADIDAGQTSFAHKCAACHRIGSDEGSEVGPRLDGVVGRRAGAAQGFAHYSVPMGIWSWAGARWTNANLDGYLKKPGVFLPGTKMTFYGVASPNERQNIIAYLASFPSD
jgi:cytochrome c